MYEGPTAAPVWTRMSRFLHWAATRPLLCRLKQELLTDPTIYLVNDEAQLFIKSFSHSTSAPLS